MMRNRLRPQGRYPRRRQVWPAAVALGILLGVPAVGRPAGDAQQAAPGVKVEKVVVSKTPYYTNIATTVSGKIENYNSFKLSDPFRIVVDLWGVAQGSAASEVPVETPQVKSVKLSQQGDKLRMLVTTPEDTPLPFLVTAEGNRLVLSVGGGQEEKVTSLARPDVSAAGAANGKTVLGVDLEDLPAMSNVVVTTSSDLPHKVVKGKDSVTLVFPGATADKGLLRTMDARSFDIPVKTIRPSVAKDGIKVAVAFAPGAAYAVEGRDNAVVLSFPKKAGANPGTVVAEVSEREPGVAATEGGGVSESTAAAPRWGFVTYASGKKKRYVGQRISLDIKDADLANVFRIIAEVSNLNIITTDDVKGRVSVRLINVPWDQALDIILQSKALGVSQQGNVLRIAPLAKLRAEDKARLDAKKDVEKLRATLEGVIETIPVNYSKASDLKSKIQDLLSEGGKVQIDDRTNTIIVRDLRKNVDDIKALVAKLDTATPQVLIEARIVEVDTTFTRELGVQWGGSYKNGTATQIGASGIQDSLGAFLPGQPLANTTPFTSDSAPPTYAVNLPAAFGQGAGGGISFGILRDNLRLDLSLSALEASGKGKVVSSPKVVTIDNKEAMIEQGTQIPYSTVSASGTNTQFVDATLSLKVTPHITPEGSIIMKLEAKNDSQGEVGASGQPAINKKKATTEVLVMDGQTAVIGGILQVSRRKDEAAVPWLSRIPVLGYLFRNDSTDSENRELLIFITPKIIKPESVQARAS